MTAGIFIQNSPAIDTGTTLPAPLSLLDDPNLDLELVVNWIYALESDTYHQGTGQLAVRPSDWTSPDDFGYCCAGVLCDVAERMRPPTENPELWQHSWAPSDVLPPSPICKAAGIKHDLGRPDEQNWTDYKNAPTGSSMTTLVALNDAARWSFNSIAQVLRRYYGLEEI